MYGYLSERLSPDHDVEGFDSGQPSLDTWLVQQASRAQRYGTARTSVWTPHGSSEVVAFYSLAPTELLREDLTGKLAGGFSRVPGYMLARLALHKKLQGQGLGAQLLVDALEAICSAAELTGGRVIVVDPIDEKAREFYLHFGFLAIEKNDRLSMLVIDAAANIGLA